MRRAAQEAGVTVEIDSAGTGDWHVGHPPDPRAQKTALRYGLDISGYCARQIEAADFARFTHIFALDRSNLSHIRALGPPGCDARIGLLLDMVAGREGQDVADPYYGDDQAFEKTWSDVDLAARMLVRKLMA